MKKFLSLVFLCTLLAGCQSPPKPAKAPAEPLPLAAETFDRAWEIINEHHFDTNFNGVNWQAMREKYRPLALQAASAREFHEHIQEMLDLLEVSHLAIIPGDLAEVIEEDTESADAHGPGNPGLTVRIADTTPVVTQVAADSAAAKAGIKPGWIITRVGKVVLLPKLTELKKQVDARQYLFLGWKMVHGLISGEPGSQVELHFKNEKDQPVVISLEREKLPGTLVQMGSLPDLYAYLTTRELASPAGRKIGVIHFNIWMLPNALALERAVDQFRNHDGIIVDLRGNIGGVAGMVIGAAGHFIDEPVSLGKMLMRDNQINFPVNPRRVNSKGERVQPFAGPLVFITDEISVSASELFAGALQELGRAYVIGRPTTGQALPAIHDKLPNGDVLYHPFGDFVTAKGGRIESRGVVPDLPLPLNRAALLAGRDPELEAALSWIDQRPAK